MAKKRNTKGQFLKRTRAKKASAADNPAPVKARKNPMIGEIQEHATSIGVGVGSYSLNRLLSNLLQKTLGGRLGFLSNHLSPMASLGLAAVLFYIADKWAWLRRHQTSVLVGSGMAVVHTLVERYLPGLQMLLAPPTQQMIPMPVSDYVDNEIPRQITTNQGTTILEQDQMLSAITNDDEDAELMTGVFARN